MSNGMADWPWRQSKSTAREGADGTELLWPAKVKPSYGDGDDWKKNKKVRVV